MTQLKAYRIEGTFPMGMNKNQVFMKELACKDEDEARALVLSLLGSEHGVKRRMVTIKEVKQLKTDEITSPQIKQILGVK